MSITNRQFRLIRHLSNRKDYVTVEELANLLNVSQRTVYYDLEKISSGNLKDQFIINKKPGLGIQGYWKDGAPIKQFEEHVDENEKRYNYLFKELVIDSKTLSIQQLSDDLFVGRSSIVEVFNRMKDEISDYDDLELIQDHKGSRVIGSESDLRSWLVNFNNDVITSGGDFFDIKTFTEDLEEYYGSEVTEQGLKVMEYIASKNYRFIAPYYEISIFSVIVILISRLKDNRHLSSYSDVHLGKNIYSMNNYVLAEELLTYIKDKFDLNFDKEDIYFLSKFLKGNRLVLDKEEVIEDVSVSYVTKDLISRISIAVNEDLTDDKVLEQDLTLHIYHMVYRMKNGVYIKNPLLNDIIKDFRLVYDLVWLMMEKIETQFSIDITEDEIGFLLLHFQSALDKRKKSRLIYVVLENSYVSPEFSIHRIRNVLSPLDIIKHVTLQELVQTPLEQVDLIISTIPITSNYKNKVMISPLVNDRDVQIIAHKYQSLLVKDVKTSYSFVEYLNFESIYLSKNADSKQEILDTMISDLESMNYVTKDFKDSVWSRERRGATDIGYMSAVPHGSMNEVLETSISIWINDKPVNWGQSKIQIIILYAIAPKDLKKTKEIIKSILWFTKNSNEILQNYKAMTPNSFVDYLNGGFEDDQ